MKTIRSNRRKIYYRQYLGKKALKDSDGYETGEHEDRYGRLSTLWVNVTAGKGQRYVREFGGSEEYDRKLVVKGSPLKTDDILWVDTLPFKRMGYKTKSVPHNYVVVGHLRGLNHTTFLIRKVRVDG